jgi:hypothetical protein
METYKIGDFEIKQWAADYKRYIDFQVRVLPLFSQSYDSKEFITFEEFLVGDISRITNPLTDKIFHKDGRWRF